ncbi:MAG: hypothetical protein HYU25_08555 [Candidatus Rokubacteria bacterium]|nr:hypothetical protein [Candidatus Rokubacteria bacterium]
MTVPVQEWGRRLSDTLRAALESGNLAAARRLALEGDGQARSLAKEYSLMYRGLGITIRVLLPLLRETAARAEASPGVPAASEAASLVHRFQTDMAGLMRRAWGDPAPPSEPPGTLDEEIARTARVLEAGEARFEQEQARLADEIVRAIEAGEGARARTLVDVKEQSQYLPLHDRLIRFMAESFGWVLRRFGPGELRHFHMATAEGQRPGFEKWERMSAAAFARASAFLLKQHMGQVAVREDGEKFTIEQAPCGSGGRLRLAGAYAGPDALPFVEERGPLTLGQARFPVYCSHCPIWNGVAPVEWFGRPHWVFDEPARPDGGCTLHVYKRRDGAPAAYLARLGPPSRA